MTRHVWVLNHYAQTPREAGGTRHFSLAQHLPAHGWSASIIGASVEHNTNRQRLASGERSRIEQCEGVRFLWLRTTTSKGNGGGRALNMLVYALRALIPGNTAVLARPDVIIGSSVHPLAALAGAILARRHRVPFVFEVRDLWPETLIDMGMISRNGLAARTMRAMEKWMYRRAARIIVLLPDASAYLTSLGPPADRIIWIPNGIDLATFPEPAPADQRNEFTLMYFGAHGEANGLGNLLRAMVRVAELNLAVPVKLRLIGAGPQKLQLIKLAGELGLSNVSFEDSVPKSAIPGLAGQADAFVFNLIEAPVFRFGISSNKLYDFLAGSRPILFCCRASNNPVEEAGAGITVEPNHPEELASQIARLATLPLDERQKMGRAGRRFVEERHDYRELARRLALLLDEVLAEAGGRSH